VADDSFRFARIRGQLVWVEADATADEIEAALNTREARREETATVAASLPVSFVPDDPRPLLLIDVDGVICPYGDELGDPDAAGLALTTIGYSRVWLSHRVGACLLRLQSMFQLVWCTAWEDMAAEVLAPHLGMPPMPVIHFDAPTASDGHWKWPAIEAFVADRPFAWIDDEIASDDFARAARRTVPTMLVRVEGARGLDEKHVNQLEGFATIARAWLDPEPLPEE
jgi:hypothetical protein